MAIIKSLLAKNRSWASQQCLRDPGYFRKHAEMQKPHTVWIGCSDSRVPAELLTGSSLGELFIHRNIANVVSDEDDSLMSVLQYALEHLNVSNVVLCGHYGCGGIHTAVSCHDAHHTTDTPLSRHINEIRDGLKQDIDRFQGCVHDREKHLNQLVESHVEVQFSRLLNTPPLQGALSEGRKLDVYGCVYDIHAGHLKPILHHSSKEVA